MKLKLNIVIICFLLGIVMMTIHFTSSSTTIIAKADSINLALRQAAHHLYSIKGDTTASIPPVEQISANHFSLVLDKAINYDTLPFLLQQAFLDFDIPSTYEVTIRDCQENSILLGYNYVAFENANIPCLGRDQMSNCNILGLSFPEKKASNNTSILLSTFFFLIGFGTLFLMKSSTAGKVPIIPTSEKPKEKTIHLGNSFFVPQNLTIKVDNEDKALTFRESKLLAYFFNNPNQVLQRDDIKLHVWGDEGVIVGRSVDVFVSRLRKILKEDQSLEIKNVHGVGYRLKVWNDGFK